MGSSIYIQFGNYVYKLEGTTFNKIGTLDLGQTLTSNICTNGTNIFASDGTYYNPNTNTWASFIGSGKNLKGSDETRYNQLKTYCSSGLSIGVIGGSSPGPVYLLGLTELIQITPIF